MSDYNQYPGFSSDTRTLKKGQIFVALKGLETNGYDYIQVALDKGAALVVCEKCSIVDKRVFLVEDSHLEHRNIAHIMRNKYKAKIIGIVGSNGKTSTKEFLYSLLSSGFNCFKTEGSQNGFLGIPKTLELLSAEMDYGIIEIGIDDVGAMQKHIDLVNPDFLLLSSISEEHLENLVDIDTVAFEEFVAVHQVLNNDGVVFVPRADSVIKYYCSKFGLSNHENLKQSNNNSYFFPATISPILKQNCELAASCAEYLGLDIKNINKVLEAVEAPQGRGQLNKLNDDYWVLEDHYNSNPASLNLAIEYAEILGKENHKELYFIIGDMNELGLQSDSIHEEFYKKLMAKFSSHVVFIGPQFHKVSSEKDKTYQSVDLFIDDIQKHKKLWENAIILVKGSRGIELEKLYSQL